MREVEASTRSPNTLMHSSRPWMELMTVTTPRKAWIQPGSIRVPRDWHPANQVIYRQLTTDPACSTCGLKRMQELALQLAFPVTAK